MSTPQRITQRHDAAYRRRELIDNPEHLRTNAETLLIALRRTNRRKCRSGIVAACILFAAFAWIGLVWLTRHFLP